MQRNVNRWWIPALGLAAFLVPAVAHASIPGGWKLEMSGTLEGEEVPCVFRGTANLSALPADSKFDFGGPCHLTLASGPDSCPPSLDGQISVSGSVTPDGLLVSGEVDGGESFGLSDFTGVVVGDPTAQGTFAVTSGPFAGLNGTWNGALAVPIPTLTSAGLALLAVLLAVASAVLLRRRRSGAGPPEAA